VNTLIVICFLEKVWSTRLKKQIASQKIDLCFTILRELSERYWAASFFLSYFEAAFERAQRGAKPNRNLDNMRALPNGDGSILPRESTSTLVGQASSMPGSFGNNQGIVVTSEPVYSEPGYQDIPPENFWADFIEDFQQTDSFGFDFNTNLDRF